MTSLSPEFFIRLSNALGYALLHSLWQGLIVALILAVCLSAIGKLHANIRCQAASLAIFFLPLWIAATFTAEWNRTNHAFEAPNSGNSSTALFATAFGNSIARNQFETSNPPAINQFNWNAIAAGGWAIGAAFFLLRFAAGWQGLRQLRRSSVPVTGVEIRRIYAGVCDRLKIRERVALLSCDRLSSPLMSGFLWPAIILPAGMLNGIPATHLESIFAHELAHYRRWDYVANICQSLIEAVLFYHPAIWWISRQIRAEREHACDDLAAGLPGNDLRRYAGALAWLEENRFHSKNPEPALAMARDQRDTLSRIGRLREVFTISQNPAQQGSVTHSTVLAWCLVAAFGVTIASASPPSPRKLNAPVTAPTIKSGPEDSVFSQCQAGRTRAEHSTRLVKERIAWEPRIWNGIEVPLFRSVVILEKGGKLFNLDREKPRLFPEFPNHYLLNNDLNLLDSGLPQRDPDRDGFTILEEFQANTDPNDSESHPDYAGKLQFISRRAQIYRVTFAARLDDTRFQLNRHPSARWNRKTMIHRIGEVSSDGQLRLDKPTEHGLEITFLASDISYRLPKREQVEIPTWFAELQLGLPGEEAFFVELSETFRLDRQPDRILRLVAVEESGVEVIDPQTGDTWRIGSLAKSSH